MLERTFLFLSGIGPAREMRLWRRGVTSWEDYRALPRVPGVRQRQKERHDEVLAIARGCLGRDAPFFARVLPSNEHWRTFDHFHERAAYLDIETTGDRENVVTVVGVRFRGENRAFVLPRRGLHPDDSAGDIADAGGLPYTPEAVGRFLRGATCLVTFNGASFDLPVLRGEGVPLPDVPHVDLRTVFRRIGQEGGLKKIEDALGMGRQDELAGLTGWDAVKLWRKWETKGRADALRTLVAYNVADFENLEPLAAYACQKLRQQTMAEITAQQHLPQEPAGPEADPAGP